MEISFVTQLLKRQRKYYSTLDQEQESPPLEGGQCGCNHRRCYQFQMLWKEQENLAKEPLTKDEEQRILGSYRAAGDCICEVCGKIYYRHKQYKPSGKTNNGVPWLVEICNGDLVKL
jgi:hypothetical protein